MLQVGKKVKSIPGNTSHNRNVSVVLIVCLLQAVVIQSLTLIDEIPAWPSIISIVKTTESLTAIF